MVPYSSWLNEAYSSFKEEIGYEGCTAILPPSQSWPAYNGLAASTSASAASSAIASAVPTKVSVPGRHVHSTQIIIVSVLLPVAGLTIILLCFIIIRRYRRKRSLAAFANDPAMTSDSQLYVDRKAELEAEERRKHELEAGGIMHEVEGEDRVFEMPGEGNMRIGLASSNRVHELRGAEFLRELEVPGSAS